MAVAAVAGREVAVPEPPRGGLTTAGAVALAAAAWVGAEVHRAVDGRGSVAALGLGAVVLGLAGGRRRWCARWPALLLAAVLIGLAASVLAARARAGLDPVRAGPFRGRVVLVGDPTPGPFGTRVDVRVDGHRLELRATGAPAGTVDRAMAGEALVVSGRLRPPPPRSPWLIPRRVVGMLVVERAEPASAGSVPWRVANRVRRTLVRGAAGLDAERRGLYLGFVLGDDREQAPAVVDDFRGTGLSHLLVVSGQNLAFALVLVRPLAARVRLGLRWLVSVAAIGAFVLVTRAEPSVLRAAAMALVAVSAEAAGVPLAALRRLALAVAGLVLIDPLLVAAMGFRLSVGAALGIAVLGGPDGPVCRCLPPAMPRWLREPLAVTVGAQAGTAPILVPAFGGIPVASVPANLLAEPVAGLVTTWGLPAGLLAGLARLAPGRGPALVATALHVPTWLAVTWAAAVARVGAGLPLGEWRAPHLLALGCALAALALAARCGAVGAARALRVGAMVVVVLASVLPAWRLRSPPVDIAVPGARVVRSGGATVVVTAERRGPATVLGALRRAGVRRVDLLVVGRGADPALPGAIAHRWAVGRVLPARPRAPVRLRIGGLEVRLDPVLGPSILVVGGPGMARRTGR